MSSGQLRNLVVIERLIEPETSNGDRAKPEWKEFEKVWAGFTFSTGQETSDHRDSTQGKVMIKCRYLNGVTTKMRVNRNGEIYDIEDVYNKDDRRKYLTLVCVQANK